MSLQESRLQEPVAQRSQRKWMMHPGSVGIKSSSPWVAFHQCKRGDGRGPGHVNPHPPFRLPRGHSVHVLPLQPIKGNSVHPVGASAVWLQPGLMYHTSFHSFSYLTFFSSPSLPWVCLPSSNSHALVFASVFF